MQSYNTGSCTLSLGLGLSDPRCQTFLLVASIFGELVLYLQMFIFMASLVFEKPT